MPSMPVPYGSILHMPPTNLLLLAPNRTKTKRLISYKSSGERASRQKKKEEAKKKKKKKKQDRRSNRTRYKNKTGDSKNGIK